MYRCFFFSTRIDYSHENDYFLVFIPCELISNCQQYRHFHYVTLINVIVAVKDKKYRAHGVSTYGFPVGRNVESVRRIEGRTSCKSSSFYKKINHHEATITKTTGKVLAFMFLFKKSIFVFFPSNSSLLRFYIFRSCPYPVRYRGGWMNENAVPPKCSDYHTTEL